MTEQRDMPNEELPREFIVRMFPLPAPLFPGVRLPFHVFEPRYRELLGDTLDADGHIGIPFVRPGPPGRFGPDIAPIFGVGEVTGYKTADDGTSDIEVLGRFRVRLVEEIPSDTLYRRARVVRMDEVLPTPVEEALLVTQLRDQLSSLLRAGISKSAQTWMQGLFDPASGLPVMGAEFLVNIVSTLIIGDPSVRQAILEESSVLERSRHLGHILTTLSEELGG